MCFADEDIKLNSTLFLWPDQIEDVFENSRNLLMSKRDQAEVDLFKRYGESVWQMTPSFMTPCSPLVLLDPRLLPAECGQRLQVKGSSCSH